MWMPLTWALKDKVSVQRGTSHPLWPILLQFYWYIFLTFFFLTNVFHQPSLILNYLSSYYCYLTTNFDLYKKVGLVLNVDTCKNV